MNTGTSFKINTILLLFSALFAKAFVCFALKRGFFYRKEEIVYVA